MLRSGAHWCVLPERGSTLVRAHQQAATGKWGPRVRLLGAPGWTDHYDPHGAETPPAADPVYPHRWPKRRRPSRVSSAGRLPGPTRRQGTHDVEIYRARNRIERCFSKLKNFGRFATRYDRRAIHFLAFVQLAAAMIWMR